MQKYLNNFIAVCFFLITPRVFAGSEHILDATKNKNLFNVDYFQKTYDSGFKSFFHTIKDISRNNFDTDLKKNLGLIDELLKRLAISPTKSWAQGWLRGYTWNSKWYQKDGVVNSDFMDFKEWRAKFPEPDVLRAIKLFFVLSSAIGSSSSKKTFLGICEHFEGVLKDLCKLGGINPNEKISVDEFASTGKSEVLFLNENLASLSSNISKEKFEQADLSKNSLLTWSKDYPYKRINNIIFLLNSYLDAIFPNGFFGNKILLKISENVPVFFQYDKGDSKVTFDFMVRKTSQKNQHLSDYNFYSDSVQNIFAQHDSSLLEPDVLAEPLVKVVKTISKWALYKFLYPEKKMEGFAQNVVDKIFLEKEFLYLDSLLEFSLTTDKMEGLNVEQEFIEDYLRLLFYIIFEDGIIEEKLIKGEYEIEDNLEETLSRNCLNQMIKCFNLDKKLKRKLHFLKTQEKSVYRNIFCYINPIKIKTITGDDEKTLEQKKSVNYRLQKKLESIFLEEHSVDDEVKERFVLMRFLTFSNPDWYSDFYKYFSKQSQSLAGYPVLEEESSESDVKIDLLKKVFFARFFKRIPWAKKIDISVKDFEEENSEEYDFDVYLKKYTPMAFEKLEKLLFLDKAKEVKEFGIFSKKVVDFLNTRFEALNREFLLSDKILTLEKPGDGTFNIEKNKLVKILEGKDSDGSSSTKAKSVGKVSQQGAVASALSLLGEKLKDAKNAFSDALSKRQDEESSLENPQTDSDKNELDSDDDEYKLVEESRLELDEVEEGLERKLELDEEEQFQVAGRKEDEQPDNPQRRDDEELQLEENIEPVKPQKAAQSKSKKQESSKIVSEPKLIAKAKTGFLKKLFSKKTSSSPKLLPRIRRRVVSRDHKKSKTLTSDVLGKVGSSMPGEDRVRAWVGQTASQPSS